MCQTLTIIVSGCKSKKKVVVVYSTKVFRTWMIGSLNNLRSNTSDPNDSHQ